MYVFYCIPEDKAEETTECGIKLSDVLSEGGTSYIKAVLHPRDYPKTDMQCMTLVRIEIPLGSTYASKTYIGDSCLTGELFDKSLVKVSEYVYGMYRKPLCLLTYTVLPDMLRMYDSCMDDPLMFSSSEELYRNSRFYELADRSDMFKERALSAYYDSQYQEGKYAKEHAGKYDVYIDKETGTIQTALTYTPSK